MATSMYLALLSAAVVKVNDASLRWVEANETLPESIGVWAGCDNETEAIWLFGMCYLLHCLRWDIPLIVWVDDSWHRQRLTLRVQPPI